MITKAPFGGTGHESTRTIFGAAALSHVSHADAERTLDLLLEHGVNHIDTAASYGDSELRIASWLKRNPSAFFLATKTDRRDYKSAKEELHRSLDRLGVDHIDMLQLHNLVDVIEWEFALRGGGALEAAAEAREEGLVRFIGVTGHGFSIAAMHRRSLARFPFDSVLLPYNFRQMQDERYAAEFEALAAICERGGVAIQTIKSIALAPWDGRPQTASTWYEPLTDPEDISLAVHWVLGREGVFLNTVGDVRLLPHVLAAAEQYSGESPNDERMHEFVQRRSLTPLFV
ncbi:MAG: aldo/keto reductase [Actinobacteria bacterium]|nr:aldo/keto reductase [Actinomycetota bacterium]